MTEEFEAWAALVERIGFSAAIVGMIAYALRSVAKWSAPLVVKVVDGHNTFLQKQSESTERMEANLSTLTKAIEVKLDKRGEEYSDHVFSNKRLEDAALPALDALARIADGPHAADEAKALLAQAKDRLRG